MQFNSVMASVLAIGAATALITPPTYSNTTGNAPSYNGTTPSTNGTVSPTGSGPSATNTAAPTESFTGAGNKLFGTSAALGLALIGGVALAL